MNGLLRIYRWISEKSSTFWLALAFLLVSSLSFEAGVLQRALKESEPLVVRIPEHIPPVAVPTRGEQGVTPQVGEVIKSSVSDQKENCAFVGSKNSNKYHLPTSRCAKQIKLENKVCFESADAAKAKGYLPGCLE